MTRQNLLDIPAPQIELGQYPIPAMPDGPFSGTTLTFVVVTAVYGAGKHA